MSNLAAFSAENPAVAHLRYQDNAITDIGNFEMQCHIVPDTAVLQFVGEHKRPMVCLKGQVTKLTPTEQGAEKAQAYGIDEVTFNTGPNSSDQQPRMICDYVFDNDQIKTLIDKGLYEEGFDIPTEYLTSNELRVPMAVSMAVTAPEMAEGHSVLLYNIKDIRRSEVTLENSGFDLAEKCESVREIESEVERDYEHEVPQQQAGADMFADVDYKDRPGTYKAADQSFDKTLETSRNDQLSFVDRLRAMAPNEDLEFIGVYQDAFPSEDFVPEDVVALEQKLEDDIRDQETSPLMKRYYEERERREQEAEATSGVEQQEDTLDEIEVDDVDLDLDDEDLAELDDIFADNEFDDAQPESGEFEVATDTDTSQGDLGENAQREGMAEALEAGDGDLFADEDFEDTTQEDTAQATEEAERERRDRRRATALSNDTIVAADEIDPNQEERISAEQTHDRKKVGTEATDKHKIDEAKRRELQRQRKVRQERISRQAQQSQDEGPSM